MDKHHTIHILVRNNTACLPEAMALLNRSTIRLQAMQFVDLEAGAPAELQLDVDADATCVARLAAALEALDDVVGLSLESYWTERQRLRRDAA